MEYFKFCKIHGNLTEDQVVKTVKRGKPYFPCKICCKESRKRSHLKHAGNCKIHGKLIPELIKQDGRCKLCHRKSASRKRNENRAWFNAKMKIEREKNPEKWKEIYQKAYLKFRAKHKEEYSLLKCCQARGITLDQYQEMLEKQNGVCAICFLPETRKDPRTKSSMRLTIDHCHSTNKVRGLLCHSCNTAIGKLGDDIPRIIRAAKYIKQSQL